MRGEMGEPKYKSKGLECWPRAKELRLEHYREIARARDEGKFVVTGSAESFLPLLAGIGGFVFLAGEPYGASVGHEPEFAVACAEAAESRGFSRHLCSYMRNFWGSMFLDRYVFGGPFPRPDFCFTKHFCDAHAKWFQVVAEHYGVPCFAIEVPFGNDPASRERRIAYLEGQLLEAIEWLEKVTGRKYDDERLIEAVKNERRTVSLAARVFLLNQNIPAPLDQKTMLTLYVISVLRRHEKAAVDFYRELEEEVRDRVKERIAAVPTERCRLVDDSQPPWFFLRLYRYLENYGAVVVASWNVFGLAADFRLTEDGTLLPAPLPEETGLELRSREAAVRLLAESEVDNYLLQSWRPPAGKEETMVRLARQWRCQGAMVMLNRCDAAGLGQLEARSALQEAGIPALTIETCMADPRELHPTQVFDSVDAFMESLGLRRPG